MQKKVGFARECITPSGALSQAMPMAGYDRRKGPSAGTRDDLYVSVAALGDERGQLLLLCSFDLLGVDRPFCRELTQELSACFGIAEPYIWIGATHTHAGPSGMFYGRSTYSPEYTIYLREQCGKAARTALANMTEVIDCRSSESKVEVLASRRDLPREQSTYAMPLRQLYFQGEGQSVRWIRIACHPTVLSEVNRSYSRDLPGAAERAMKQKDGCLFSNGACGDLSTRYTRDSSGTGELERLGEKLAGAIEHSPWTEDALLGYSISAVRQTVHLSREKSLGDERCASLLSIWKERLAAASDEAGRRELEAKIAVLERKPAAAEPDRPVDISAVHLGSCLLLGLPFEIASADGERLERELAALAGLPVYLSCYTGGYDGYLPSGQPITADSNYSDIASRYPPKSRAQVFEAAKTCVEILICSENRDEIGGERQ